MSCLPGHAWLSNMLMAGWSFYFGMTDYLKTPLCFSLMNGQLGMDGSSYIQKYFRKQYVCPMSYNEIKPQSPQEQHTSLRRQQGRAQLQFWIFSGASSTAVREAELSLTASREGPQWTQLFSHNQNAPSPAGFPGWALTSADTWTGLVPPSGTPARTQRCWLQVPVVSRSPSIPARHSYCQTT